MQDTRERFEASLRSVLTSDAFSEGLKVIFDDEPASPIAPPVYIWRLTPMRDENGLIISIDLRPVARAEV